MLAFNQQETCANVHTRCVPGAHATHFLIAVSYERGPSSHELNACQKMMHGHLAQWRLSINSYVHRPDSGVLRNNRKSAQRLRTHTVTQTQPNMQLIKTAIVLVVCCATTAQNLQRKPSSHRSLVGHMLLQHDSLNTHRICNHMTINNTILELVNSAGACRTDICYGCRCNNQVVMMNL